jgi:hypothetical protein
LYEQRERVVVTKPVKHPKDRNVNVIVHEMSQPRLTQVPFLLQDGCDEHDQRDIEGETPRIP